MKIVMCASEMVPFAKTGGLADVVGALPRALAQTGHEVTVVLPLYRCIRKTRKDLRRVKGDIWESDAANPVKVYFLEHAYYDRDNLYGTKEGDYRDNLARFSHYCRRVLEALKELGVQPDILHCHDWQTGLIPVYLEAVYAKDAFYRKVKTVFTIHNLGYQGLFPATEFAQLGLPPEYFTPEALEYYGQINVLKAGLIHAGTITTVSPTYSREIQTKEYGCGLEGVLASRKKSVHGILNGLDYGIWNPHTDPFISSRYSYSTIADKLHNKAYLQKRCGLAQDPEVPLCGIVSRLAEQKGFDILAEALEGMCRRKLQMVVLGMGDLKYQRLMEAGMQKCPTKHSLHITFDEGLAHAVYAGADIFLMPSRYEPCGLGQLISLTYGTVPVVFCTGGLADTVFEGLNGFVFDQYRSQDFLKALDRALAAFEDRAAWSSLVCCAMKQNFSWDASAKQYLEVYAQG